MNPRTAQPTAYLGLISHRLLQCSTSSDEGSSIGGGSSLQHAGDDDTPVEAPSSGFLSEGHAAAAGESIHPSLLFQ